MICHFYECDECELKVPIVFGWAGDDEVRVRLPEGWMLIQTTAQTRAACSPACAERLVTR